MKALMKPDTVVKTIGKRLMNSVIPDEADTLFLLRVATEQRVNSSVECPLSARISKTIHINQQTLANNLNIGDKRVIYYF